MTDVTTRFHSVPSAGASTGAMGTGMRLFIAIKRLGAGHFSEALEECLRSPFDKIFCGESRPEVGRPARADV